MVRKAKTPPTPPRPPWDDEPWSYVIEATKRPIFGYEVWAHRGSFRFGFIGEAITVAGARRKGERALRRKRRQDDREASRAAQVEREVHRLEESLDAELVKRRGRCG